MFGMGSFDGDPFFQGHMRQMEQMGGFFNDPFFGGSPMGSMMQGGQNGRDRDMQRRGDRQRRTNVAVQDPFQSMMGADLFGGMSSMMQNMNSMMANMHQQAGQMRSDPNGHVYSQSTVMSYCNDGRGQPKIYHASSSTRQAGQVKETRKMVRDSERGIEKMAVGHHLGDRAHVVARNRDLRSGQMEENRDLINVDEAEAETFEHEWRQNAHGARATGGYSLPSNRRQTDQRGRVHAERPAIEYKKSYQSK